MELQSSPSASAASLLLEAGPLTEGVFPFRPLPVLPFLPALKGRSRNTVNLSVRDHFKHRGQCRLRKSDRALLFRFDDEQVSRVKGARRLDVHAVPPSIPGSVMVTVHHRIGHRVSRIGEYQAY